MSILDISNWTIDEINNSINTFKDTSLTDIGMVNCDIDSINIVGEVATATLWINEDVGIDEYTGTAPLKIYKEDKVEIKLNSPLLEGDTIEVVDGKLYHVHRCDSVIFSGEQKNEDWKLHASIASWFYSDMLTISPIASWMFDNIICVKSVKYKTIPYNKVDYIKNNEMCFGSPNGITKRIIFKNENFIDLEGWLQYLSSNPLTIIYQLDTPTHENITPLQSEIVLKTFNESSMIINTNLPIKTNVSYRTNVPSISTLSNRVAEVSESDNVIHNLINIIDDEVDE